MVHRLSPSRRRASGLACAARSRTAALMIACIAAAALLHAPGSAMAQAAPAQVTAYAPFITEAAQRFGIPEPWIEAVMHVESRGNPAAVSPAGAMGLMQIMPGTWAGLRARHGLGPDVFDPRDNILAGAAYLREMYDRYGAPGFLAAYNAGPGRYEEFLAGRPLPGETRAYLAMLAPVIEGTGTLPARARAAPDWREAPLFAGYVDGAERPADGAEQTPPPVADGLFVRTSIAEDRP